MARLRSPIVLLSLLLLATMAAGVYMSEQTVGATVDHVVYFKDTPSTGHLDASDIDNGIDNLGFTYLEVESWEDVLEADGEEEIDALILDAGSVELADEEWVKDAFARGVVIAGVNASLLDLNALLEDSRIDEEYDGDYSESWTSEYYSVAYAGISGPSYALTAIAADPEAIESLPTPETAYRYSSFTEAETMVPDARAHPSGISVATESFFNSIADGILERNSL